MKKTLKLLALVLVLALGMCSMAGCGGGNGKGGAAGDKGQVYVYCFGDYFDPELEYEFEEATGYDVVIDYFDTNEELYPSLVSK